jgi:hypothetical protein
VVRLPGGPSQPTPARAWHLALRQLWHAMRTLLHLQLVHPHCEELERVDDLLENGYMPCVSGRACFMTTPGTHHCLSTLTNPAGFAPTTDCLATFTPLLHTIEVAETMTTYTTL